ncbi:DoxX family protein [Hymenobacter sp. YC55]|uniref:DoxX family protein n=1 Tax=Hymenobacter sp. YC55 TaxID=3034019 RepID=UPI0023F90DD5|nr:DoxX family protein [Hymenobacter sp. YC55]MDF7814094.1 DoxX family protein [Hymenobacter sp. YC55]
MTSSDDFYDVDWQRRRNPADDLESGFPSTHFYHPMQATLSPATAVAAPSTVAAPAAEAPWSGLEKTVFRFAFLYFALQVVPLDWKYYHDVAVNWSGFSFGDIFRLTHYSPRFFAGPDTFANWTVVAALAVVGTAVWSQVDKSRSEYATLYYWLRVLVRYRLAAGLLGYGFLKLFPMQSPLPSLSLLNTHYGDLSDWKIFSLSLGIVPSYQSFLGLVEILAAVLLLGRRTASIGAFLSVSFLGNVFLSNLAYEGGEYVYSFYLMALALVVLWYDARRVNDLLTLERPAVPNRFRLVLPAGWQRTGRRILKAGFVLLFVGLYGVKIYAAYQRGPYHYPQTPGLPNAAGLYNVREFRLAGEVHSYSATDPERWQDVVLEQWNTLSVRSNRPVVLDESNTEAIHPQDPDRHYEFAGTAGRHYYAYQLSPDGQTLTLHNRNPLEGADTFTLRLSRPDARTITLRGTDAQGRDLHVVLEKRDKKYLLEEAAKAGRRGGLKL